MSYKNLTLFLNRFNINFKNHFSILDKYLSKEYFGPFFLGVGGFVIVGLVDILFTLVDLFVNSGVSLTIVIRLLIYKIPAIMVLFFPMALLFAVMLLLVRMAKDNEITVLRASGVSLFRILYPIAILAIITTALSFFIEEKIVPWANHVSDNLIRMAIYKTPPPEIIENVFFKDEGDRYFYIKRVDSRHNIMQNVMVFEITPSYPKIITAKTAQWDKKTWVLDNGNIQSFDDNGTLDYTSTFKKMRIYVEREITSFYTEEKSAREMDAKELKTKIKNLEKSGLATKALRVDYHMKYSMPMACFIFCLIGIAFCLSFVRSGKDWWGVIWAICIAILAVGFYFFTVAVFRSLGRGDIISPFLGAWLPNIIYGGISGIIITYQLATK
ncbi:MAG: LptF/LptG family permease [Candidatus Margulisiibacteriota bacterium]|jgi:lipopolysaccharide export system permease protein